MGEEYQIVSQCPELSSSINLQNLHMRQLSRDYTVFVQPIISLSKWSGGVQSSIHSIYDSYLELIRNSKYFIYIENQFFLGCTQEDVDPIRNYVVLELHNRLDRAIQANELFRLVIVVSSVPDSMETNAMDIEEKKQLINCQQRVLRDLRLLVEQSLFNYCSKRTVDEYLQYLTLKSYSQRGQEEELFIESPKVHTNTMIVDDRIALVGSADVSDRSLLGDRNSELGLLLVDTKASQSQLNGKVYYASAFSRELRKSLWVKHLALPSEQIYMQNYEDLMSDKVWKGVKEIAKWNRQIFDQVFHSTDLKTMEEKRMKLSLVQGSLVELLVPSRTNNDGTQAPL